MKVGGKNNISRDRVEIYKDFTLNLLYYIFHYYLDKDTLSLDQDIMNHFNWCYGKVCDEFIKEGLNFIDNKELRQYFFTYYYHQFYKLDSQPQDMPLSHYEKFWKRIFEINKEKNKNILKIFLELYEIYDKSINKKEKMFEMA